MTFLTNRVRFRRHPINDMVGMSVRIAERRNVLIFGILSAMLIPIAAQRLLKTSSRIDSLNQSRNMQEDLDENNNGSSVFDVGGFVDSETCWENLITADSNSDGVVDRNEYVDFAKLESIGTSSGIENINQFLDLPLAYQLAYLTTSCLCNNPGYGGNASDTACCVGDSGVIRIPDSGSIDETTVPSLSEKDEAYLYATCVLTSAASETVQTPVGSPSTTPSIVQTTLPSYGPSSPPTTYPSSIPISVPTLTPSIAPSTVTTTAVVRTNATVVYQISIRNGTALINSSLFETEYLSNLQLAMNRLATNISNESFNMKRRLESRNKYDSRFLRMSHVVRHMENFDSNTRLELPTEFQEVKEIACPKGRLVSIWGETKDSSDTITLNTVDLCQQVTATVHLISDPSSVDLENITSRFENDLYNSIYDGKYQKELDVVYASEDQSTKNPIVVLTGYREDSPTQPTSIPSDDSFSSGAIAAITLGAVAGILIPIALFLSQRFNRGNDEFTKKPDYQEYAPDVDGPDDLENMPGTRTLHSELRLPTDATSIAGSQQTDFAVKSTESLVGVVGATSLGAAPFEFHGKAGSKRAMQAMMLEEGDDIVAEPGVDMDDDKDDSSSNAGSSGWSSSAGISSLNTGSVDDSSDIAAAAGATLAGIGLASATFRQQQQKGTTITSNRSSGFNAETTSGDDDDSVDNNIRSNKKLQGDMVDDSTIIRDQLDSLIESGDWAAVGATAALLAAASDSQSLATRSSKNSRSGISEGNSAMSVDAARAAELDHLVDAGDWEGVVLAAAKFEAAAGSSPAAGETTTASGDGSRDSRSRANSSSQDSSVDDSAAGTGTFTGTFDPSVSTSVSDDPSRAAKLAEYRAEVEALVRRVVPEEIENVDEMMNQFKGREEELVETLRTMQERAVAQKARQAGHKHAKLEARRTVQRGVVPGTDALYVATLESKKATGSASESARTHGTSDPVSVGTVAATVITGAADVEFVAFSNISEDVGSVQQRETSGVQAVDHRTFAVGKISALDQAIAENNWVAAGEAAAMMSGSSETTMSAGEVNRLAEENYSTTSTDVSEHSLKRHLAGVNTDRAAELDAIIDKGDWNAVVSIANRFTEEDNSTRNRSAAVAVSRMSKEEEDALREAELWMKIAEQKKAEGATDAGASDAAEWAIQRSLSQLRDAEKKEKARSSSSYRHHGDDEDEV